MKLALEALPAPEFRVYHESGGEIFRLLRLLLASGFTHPNALGNYP